LKIGKANVRKINAANREREMGKAIRERFADFIIGTEYKDLPEEVVYQTKLCVLDLLGVALAGSNVGLAPLMTDMICEIGGKEEATIIGDGRKLPALSAALVNSVRGHTIDYDDGHRYAGGHPGVVVIPPAIAIAERENLTGKALIESVVAGYKTFICTGTAVNPSHLKRGFHTTGTVGAFAAAGACAKLLGLSKEETENALAIAGLQSAGLLEALVSGQMMKALHPGKAAQAGVMAAVLAQRGAVGPELIFEGDKGFFRAFSDVHGLTEISPGMEKNLGMINPYSQMYFKFHATCRATHASIDAALEICKEQGLGPRNIQEIEIETFPVALSLCGDIVCPDTILAAKFSIPFSVAMAISTGDLFVDKFTEENIKNEDIKALASKVKLSVGQEWAKAYPEKRGASVTIKTNSGQYFTHSLPFAIGARETEDSGSVDRLMMKFHSNSSLVLSEEQSKQLGDSIMNLENLSVRDITRLVY